MSGFLATAGAFAAFAFPSNPAGVTVLGAVTNPGLAPISGPISLGGAVRQRGGFLFDANRKAIVVLKARGAVAHADWTVLGTVPAVEPGDVVIVPKIDLSRHVLVTGGVAAPGTFEYRPQMTLLDALLAAQPVEGAAVETIKLHRPAQDGTLVTSTHSLSSLLASPIYLESGDRVEVPYYAQGTMTDRQLLTIVVIGLLVILLLR